MIDLLKMLIQPEADIMAVAQKPFNASIFGEKSGPPAWKQLPTWYQISESDLMIPPAAQHQFRKTNECHYNFN